MSVKELHHRLTEIDKRAEQVAQKIKGEIFAIPLNDKAGHFETELLEKKGQSRLRLLT